MPTSSNTAIRPRGQTWRGVVLAAVTAALLAAAAPMPAAAAGKGPISYRASHALIIGVSNYTAGWPKLESIPGEVARVERALERLGFQVTRRMDPGAEQLKDAVEDFIGRYGFDPDNRLLVFFAGHGYSREGGAKGYLVPADAPNPEVDEPGFLRKALSMTRVLSFAREMEARHALFLFDSCFSGAIFKTRALPETPPHISRLTAEPVRQFITAGSAGEEVPANSVFTPAFVDALEHAQADLDRDGFVTGTELGMFIQSTVPRYVDQTPQYGKIADYDLSRGDFVFDVSAVDRSAGRVETAAPAAPARSGAPAEAAPKPAPQPAPRQAPAQVASAPALAGRTSSGQTPVALLPHDSSQPCFYAVGRDLEKGARSYLTRTGNGRLVYSYLDWSAKPKDVVALSRLWTGNAVRREPVTALAAQSARKLGADLALLAWYRCSANASVTEDQYGVEVYLIDARSGQVHGRAETRQIGIGRTAAGLLRRYFEG